MKTGHTCVILLLKSLGQNSQICHIFILLHSVARSALGAAARLGV